MVKAQRMKVANEKASKNVTQRGNVPKTSVSLLLTFHTFLLLLLPYVSPMFLLFVCDFFCYILVLLAN